MLILMVVSIKLLVIPGVLMVRIQDAMLKSQIGRLRRSKGQNGRGIPVLKRQVKASLYSSEAWVQGRSAHLAK